MTFEYRDDDGDSLAVAMSKTDEGQSVVWMQTSRDGIHVHPDRVEEVVAGIRDAARQASGQQPDTDAVRRTPCSGLSPCEDGGEPCDRHEREESHNDGEHELCGAECSDPTIADDPVQLRWGLGDVLHSDDDTVIVCLSGPDREPYWLELDAERAAALRDELLPERKEIAAGPANSLRDQLRRAICEASGFAWDSDMLEPDEYGEHADVVLAVLDAHLAAGLSDTQPAVDHEQLVHVGWWCWRGNDHGHLADTACRSDNVPLHAPAEWATEMRAVIEHLTDNHEPGQDCSWVTPEEQAAETLAAADVEEDETR